MVLKWSYYSISHVVQKVIGFYAEVKLNSHFHVQTKPSACHLFMNLNILTKRLARRFFSGLVLSALMVAGIRIPAQTAYYWVGRDWTSGSAYGAYWGYSHNWATSSGGSGLALPNAQNYLNFDGGAAAPANGAYNVTNDNYNAAFQIYFKSAIPAAYNLYGNPLTFYDSGGIDPNIQNEGTAYTPTINLAVTNGNNNGSYRILNINLNASPAQGPLTFNGPIYGGAADTNPRVINIGGGNITFNNTIANGGGGGTLALTMLGSGTITLAATNTFTGDLSINAGTVQLTTNSAVSAGGAIRLGDVSGSTGANLNLNGGNAVSALINARATTGPKVVANTTGTTGTATFAGNLYLDGALTSYANSGGSIIWSGTTLDLKNQTLTVDGPANTTISGSLTNSTGSGKVTKQGAGTLILSGANTNTGGLLIKAGTVTANNASGYGATANVVILGDSSGAAVTLAANGSGAAGNIDQPVTVAGTGVNTISGTWNVGGQINLLRGLVTLNSQNLTINSTGNSGWRVQGGVTGTGNLTLQANGTGNIDLRTVAINNTGAITNSGTGAGVVQQGSATSFGANVTSLIQNTPTSAWNVNQANGSFLGTVQVLAGTMMLQNAGSLNVNNAVSVGSGAKLDIQNVSQTIAGLNNVSAAGGMVTNTTGTGASTLTLGGSGTYSFGGSIGANAILNLALTKAGSGTQLLTGASFFASTTVGGGLLVIGGGSVTNSGALIVGNTAGTIATMTVTNATVFSTASSYIGNTAGASTNQLTVGAGGVWNVGNQALRVASGGLVTNNTLLVTDGGLVTNVGVTYLSDNAGSFGNSLIISNNGQFISNDRVIVGQGGGSRSQQLIVAAGGKLYTKAADSAIGNNSSLGNTATVTGAGSLWDQGGRSLRIGANTSGQPAGTNNALFITSGGTVSNVGSIYLPDYGAGVANGIVISNGGQFYGGNLTLGQGNGGISNYYFLGGLGAGSYASLGAITVGGNAGTVGNQVIITNATMRTGGTVTVGNNVTATNNSLTVLTGGVLDLSGNMLHSAAGVSNNVVISGGVVTNLSGSFIWGDSVSAFGDTLTVSNGGKIYATGSIMEIGRNTGSLSNSVIISGVGSTWNAGAQTLTVGGTFGTTTGSVLAVSSGGLFTNGSITVSGNGTGHSLVVNGGTVYANTLTVNSGGMVQLNGGGADSLYADVISGSSSMVITGAAASVSSVIVGWNNGSSSVGPLLAGNLALTKTGSGILTLTNANHYTGATLITAGTVSVSSDANLGSAPGTPAVGSLVVNGGTLSASAGFTLAPNRGLALGPNSGSGGGTLEVASGTLIYGGIVANNGGGSGLLTKASAGNLLLGGANSYSGGTVISAGTLQLGSTTALGTGGATNNSGATLDLNGVSINNPLSLTGAGVGGNGALVNNNTSAASTVSNNILGLSFTAGGAGNLVLTKLDQANSGLFTLSKVGAGTLYLSGTNLNYQMALTVNGGTVVLNKINADTTWDWAVDRSPVINSGTLQIGAVGEQIQTDQGLTINGGAFDLGGFSQSINYLAGSGGFVTNSGVAPGTLVVGATQFGSASANSTYSGVISDGGATVALTKAGTNILTLAGANTYTGNTMISAGTLALTGNGSISNSFNIILGAAAKLDVSGLSGPLVLGSSHTLTGSGGAGVIAGNVNLNAGSLALNYTNGTPVLAVTNGTLAFNSNAVTVNVSGVLARGTYKLIFTNAGGFVSGALPASVTVNGLGAVVSSLSLSNSELYLTVDHPPVSTPMTVIRTAGLRLHIAWSDVATNWSDVDGDTVNLAGINLVSTNGMNVLTNSSQILYTNNANVADQLSYTISDGYGGTNTGYINIVIAGSVTGTNSIANINIGGSTNAVIAYGIPGYSYILERATNLVPAIWVGVSTNAAATNGVINATDSFNDLGNVAPGSAYYRLKWQP